MRFCSRTIKKLQGLVFYDYLFQFKTRLFRFKQQEIVALESQIQQKMENQRNSGVDLDSTCQICLKTKFADGIGHLCNYCNVRCCARCGGKVALRSNKVRKYSLLPNSTPWAIIKQSFLKKSFTLEPLLIVGQWKYAKFI